MRKFKFSVGFRLEQRKKFADDEEVQILTDITFAKHRIWYYTGYRISKSKWIDKLPDGTKVHQVKKNTINKRGECAAEINARLRDISQAVHNVFNRLSVNDIEPTVINVRTELKKELDEEARANRPLVEYYAQFIEETKENNTWTKATVTKHNTLIAHIQGFKKHIEFDDITEDFLNAFIRYLINEKNLSNTYVVKLTKNFKTFMNWATKKGFNKTSAYKDFAPKLKGVAASDKTNIFVLSEEEIEHLFTMKIENKCLDRVRDVFCFCSFTSLRYSDVKNLKWSNIVDNHLEIVTIKTNDPLIVPLAPNAMAIIKKYEPFKEVNTCVLPVISNQKYNDYLKELGKLAGFDQPTTKVIYKGSERIEITAPKYKFLTSHVGRKTFTTTMLSHGVSPVVVRACTGHKSATVMDRYVNISDNVKAEQIGRVFNYVNETVFDYAITDAECAILDIEGKDEYMKLVATDKDLAIFHLARLFQRRGNKQDVAECLQKLSKERMVEFLQIEL